jgi:hypothetical protein
MFYCHYDPFENGKIYLAKQVQGSPDEYYIYNELEDVYYTRDTVDGRTHFQAKTQAVIDTDKASRVRRVTNSPLDRKLCTIDPSKVDISKELDMLTALAGMQEMARRRKTVEITRVIFNDPATIVFWSDGKKTVVKAVNEPFDPEKGLAMAIAKRVLGNQGNYYNELKKWLPKKEEGAVDG